MPMAAWNLMMVVLALAIYATTGQRTSLLEPLLQLSLSDVALFKVLALGSGGATHALNFLRDLFVCVALSPLIVWLVGRGGLWAAALLTVTCLFVNLSPVIYRASLPMFFTWGIWFGLTGNSLNPSRRMKLAFGIALLAVVLGEMLFGSREFFSASGASMLYDTVRRAVVAGTFLSLANVLAARHRLYALFARIEPSIFLAFLSHSAVILLMWGPWAMVFGADVDGPYPLFFTLAPLIVLAGSLAVEPVLARLPCWLQIAVRGKVRRGRIATGTVPALGAGAAA
jgi:succinoglycan biosynthesis protein ExoH